MAASTSGATTTKPYDTKYKYTTIKEAYDKIRSGQVSVDYVNLYCVVLDCSTVRTTSGTDRIRNIKVADSTTAEMGYDEGVELLCFCHPDQLEKMPQPDKEGDIVRLHRVKVNEYNGKPQLVGKVCQPFRYPFHYLLYHRDLRPELEAAPNWEFKPYQSSSNNHSWDEERDPDRLRAARALSRSLGGGGHAVAPGGTPPPPSVVKGEGDEEVLTIGSLHELAKGRKFGLTCRVLYVLDSGAKDNITFAVWDGTDVKDHVVSHREPNDEDLWDSFPECKKAFQDDRVEAESKALACLMEQDRPELYYGTALYVRVPHQHREKVLAINPAAGDTWVRFEGLRVVWCLGQAQALYTGESSWRAVDPTPCADGKIAQMVDAARRRAALNVVSTRIPGLVAEDGRHVRLSGSHPPASPTSTKHPGVPYRTLRQVRAMEGLGKVDKHHVCARIIGFQPDEHNQFCKPMKLKGGGRGHVFRLTIRIEDSTGDLDVELFGKDAERVLGQEACDLTRDQDALDRVSERLNHLMGFKEEDGEDVSVWLELCIYNWHSDKARPYEGCKYRVFDTFFLKKELGDQEE